MNKNPKHDALYAIPKEFGEYFQVVFIKWSSSSISDIETLKP